MGVCPKCKKPVDDQAANCPACGQQMPAASSGTLDVDAHYEGDSKKGKAKRKGKKAKQPPLDQPVAEDAKGTLQTPDADQPPAADSGDDLAATIDSVESSAGDDAQATFDLEDVSATNAEQGPTVVEETLDSTDLPADEQATVQLPNSRSAAPAHGTHEYGEEEIKAAQTGNGKSGTAGRLKRLWGGAAGSSANPMHTLKGEDALATDSVFARVAERVLVTDTAIEIAESVGTTTASQPERKARVAECIAIACQGGDMESADYDLTGFLGQGGMGVVLKARQKAIGREVAIKMIQPMTGKSASSTLAQQKKFFYEAQITGKLDHPNIVPIYELGISNKILFYSMKMIVGTEWKDVIKSKSRDDNLDILMKVADAMAFAHQRQIIHRDLKPENVMLGAFGEVLVTDWGCAVDLTRNERFGGAGSPPWMAPEMADHDLRKIGPRSDIYLLGAMLYQVIAGYPPHPGRTVFECIQAAQKNVILPQDIEDPLLDIAMRAMETEPEDRFVNVEAMQEAIREYRRHAESITLTDRSEALLEQAIASKDYERFSRTIFGFQDAVELWPANSAAVSGLATARLAYGQVAYDKGDYDLCLQALDKSVAAEAELYRRAEKAKKAADGREGRIRTLRKLVAAVVLIGLGVSSVAAGWAWIERGKAIVEQKKATAARDVATAAEAAALVAKDKEETAKIDALAARDAAKKAEAAALLAKDEEEKAKLAAQNAQKLAEEAEAAALLAKDEEEKAKMAETLAKNDAIEQKQIAENRLAQIELASFQSKLALSLSRVKQQDVASADVAIAELVSPESYKALSERKEQPKFDNWAWDRVNLLSNRELLGAALGDQVSAVSFARDANIGVVATTGEDGNRLQLVRLDGKQLVALPGRTTPAAVKALSISPNGEEVVYSLTTAAGGNGTVYSWRIRDGSEPVELSKAEQRSMQGFVVTDTQVVAGINGGIWVWTRTAKEWQAADPKYLRRINGELQSLQMLEGNTALAVSMFEGQAKVYLVDLAQAQPEEETEDTSGLIAINADEESDFAKEQITAAGTANGKLVVGTASGNLYSVDMEGTAGNATLSGEFRAFSPQLHRSPIRTVQVHVDGTLLTTAEESVVNVWRPSMSRLSGWQHDTSLVGTQDNVASAAFMASSSLILGVGIHGQPIVWDVERQKQRQQLTRRKADGAQLQYNSPVIEVVTAEDSSRAISIHKDGTLDAWNLVTGETLSSSGVPGDYVGHTPGAVFVDMAIDDASGILITSALLPSLDESQQLNQALRTWEFCKWNIANGNMLDRWTRESPTEQEISLADGGSLILYASDKETLLQEAGGLGEVRFVSKQFGSFFSVANPQIKNMLMLVKRSGAVRVLDSQNPSASWDDTANQLDAIDSGRLLSVDDVPLVGQWSPAGDRFYMIWSSGRITEVAWDRKQLFVKRDIMPRDLKKFGVAWAGGADERQEVRFTSRHRLDLKVREQDGYNLAYIAVRFPGAEGRTSLARFAFPKEDGEILAATAESEVGEFRLVLSDADTPELETAMARLPVASRHVVAARSFGQASYFATTAGTVYRVPQAGNVTALGRPETLAASGNQSADRIVTLHAGGVLWRADYADGAWDWQRLNPTSKRAQRIALSSDGERILVQASDEDGQPLLTILDAASGTEQESIPGAVCGAWDADGLAVAMADGSLEMRRAGGVQPMGQVLAGLQPVSLHFFTEAWAPEDDGQVKDPNRWLTVHAKSESSESTLQYFSLDQPQLAEEVRALELGAGITKLACSPTEGILVTGGAGTVTVRFASPTLTEFGSELFSLEGHAGAEITCIEFAQDGKTLITADGQNRLYGWMSRDALGGISQVLPAEELNSTVQ